MLINGPLEFALSSAAQWRLGRSLAAAALRAAFALAPWHGLPWQGPCAGKVRGSRYSAVASARSTGFASCGSGPPGLGKCADARHPRPWASRRRDPRPGAARHARPPTRARSPSKREPGMAPSRAPGGRGGAGAWQAAGPRTRWHAPQARRETATSPSQTEPLSAYTKGHQSAMS